MPPGNSNQPALPHDPLAKAADRGRGGSGDFITGNVIRDGQRLAKGEKTEIVGRFRLLGVKHGVRGFGVLTRKSGEIDCHRIGSRVKILEDRHRSPGMVLALKQLAVDADWVPEKWIQLAVPILEDIVHAWADLFSGRNYFQSRRHQIERGIEVDILARVIGDGVEHVPKCRRMAVARERHADPLDIVEVNIELPVAGNLAGFGGG